MSTSEERAPYLGVPPARVPRRVTDVRAVRGKRVILSQPDGFIYDVRATSELYDGPDGRPRVDVCWEHEWYAWQADGCPCAGTSYPAYLVWVE